MLDQAPSKAPPRKILLAADLSARGDRALDRAAQLALQWDAALVILHAVEPVPVTSPWREVEPPPPRRPDARLAIERQIRRDLREEVPNLSIVIEEGDPVEIILQVAEREACDLLILGAARHEPFGRVLRGASVERLVRRSPITVLVVRNRPRGPYQHLLIGTDFTEESRYGLKVATALFTKAVFVLMHAFELPYRSLLLDNQLSHDFAAMEVATIEDFVAQSGLSPEVLARVHTKIEHGPPEAKLREYIEQQGADLTVIGALGRGVLFHMLIGGATPRIVDGVPSDVLVVRASNEG